MFEKYTSLHFWHNKYCLAVSFFLLRCG